MCCLRPFERGGEEVRRPAPGRPAGEGGCGPPAVRKEGRDGQNPPSRGQAGPGLLPGTQARRAPGDFLCSVEALASVELKKRNVLHNYQILHFFVLLKRKCLTSHELLDSGPLISQRDILQGRPQTVRGGPAGLANPP